VDRVADGEGDTELGCLGFAFAEGAAALTPPDRFVPTPFDFVGGGSTGVFGVLPFAFVPTVRAVRAVPFVLTEATDGAVVLGVDVDAAGADDLGVDLVGVSFVVR
jgi:hypothetical protein